MTQLTNPATHDHPNFVRAQAASAATRLGDYGPTFDMLAEEIILENGPGAGPWHIAHGKEDMALMLMEFSAALGDTFRQDGRCVYADDRVIINLIHETGTAPDGDEFDNLAVYVGRLRPDGQIDRMWTVDLDTEHCEEFWRRNHGQPSKDFG
jgi:hypothetical protein